MVAGASGRRGPNLLSNLCPDRVSPLTLVAPLTATPRKCDRIKVSWRGI